MHRGHNPHAETHGRNAAPEAALALKTKHPREAPVEAEAVVVATPTGLQEVAVVAAMPIAPRELPRAVVFRAVVVQDAVE